MATRISRMTQKNLAKHPMHPAIPSPRKLPINPNICTPQPSNPKMTKAKTAMPIIAMIVRTIDISKVYHFSL